MSSQPDKLSVASMHLVLPMSGQGRRFHDAGYIEPKPLVSVNGEAMISRLLSCFDPSWPTHFVLADNHMQTKLPALLARLRPNARISAIPPHAYGPGHALDAALQNIPDEEGVLVSYCDYGMRWDRQAFEDFIRETECDACVVSYRGFHPHYTTDAAYAYSRLDGDRVVEIREKSNFTDDREVEFASAGAYYFRTAKILRESLRQQRQKNLSYNGEFYTSLTVAALLQLYTDADVRIFEIDRFFQWGTPSDLEQFCFWERSYRAYNRFGSSTKTNTVAQILMPMAGLGTRFAQHTAIPKPLIPLSGVPMFSAALNTLPRAQRTVIVTLEQIAALVDGACDSNTTTVVPLQKTPAGQALSTEAGLEHLTPDKPVLVSACDHGVVLNPITWNRFSNRPDCDAAIFTMTGYAAARNDPQAYAYVRCAESDEELFPRVIYVSVKKPISEKPELDRVLVGSFWFRSARLLASAIASLKAAPTEINGELYLDSIFSILLKENKVVRAIDLDGYLCWGDPDRLAEAMYWQETYCGRNITPQPRLPGVRKRGGLC